MRARARVGVAVVVLILAACGGGGGHDRDEPAITPTPQATGSPTATPRATDTPTPVPSPTTGGAVAWAAGRELLRSDDGGSEWVATGFGGDAVSFADREVGWAVAGGVGLLTATTNGGVSWTSQSGAILDRLPILNDVAAADRQHAVAVGFEVPGLPDPSPRGPVALYTDDGGASWRRATLPASASVPAEDGRLRSVCLTSAGFGIATGEDLAVPDATLALVTTDGGRSWTDATSALPSHAGAVTACGPGNRLWFLAEGSTVRASDDGGITWHDRSGDLPSGLRVRAGAFPAGGAGWIATSSGPGDTRLGVFVTTDLGVTWTSRLDVEAGGELAGLGLDAVDDRHAVVVTYEVRPLSLPPVSAARSFATFDGGVAWTVVDHSATVDHLLDVDLVP